MELVQRGIELLERIIGNDVAARDVTEFKESGNRLDDLRGNEGLDGVQIDLSYIMYL